MKEPAIVDTACLIGLERIGRLDLLPALYDPLLAPPEVAREFGVSLPWLQIETPTNLAMVTQLKLILDDGEAEAIALAHERGLLIIVDDGKARSVAHKLGLNLIGLLRVLLRAKTEGLVPELKPLLDELEAKQFRLSKELKERALRLAGE